MADWDTGNLNHIYNNDPSNQSHSRQSSYSSGLSNGTKDHNAADDSSDQGLLLIGGDNLSQESKTDAVPAVFQNFAMLDVNGHSQPNRQPPTPRDFNSVSSGTAKAKAAKSPYAPSTIDPISEEEISIPNDANISAFSKDQIANFLRCLKIDDRIITHLHRKNVDGKRFSRLKDSELENLKMNNPVIMFFRDKSNVKNKKKSPAGTWVL